MIPDHRPTPNHHDGHCKCHQINALTSRLAWCLSPCGRYEITTKNGMPTEIHRMLMLGRCASCSVRSEMWLLPDWPMGPWRVSARVGFVTLHGNGGDGSAVAALWSSGFSWLLGKRRGACGCQIHRSSPDPFMFWMKVILMRQETHGPFSCDCILFKIVIAY